MIFYSLKKENGSALLVTIMLTGIVLIMAIILLERIIPYSQNIRNMQDALQAYYTAKSEVELKKLEFQKKSGIIKISTDEVAYSGKRENIGTEGRV
jgi:hypothetical protein